jgi:hypothetical protein
MISNVSSNYNSICELFNFSKVGFLSFEECKKEVRECKITSRTKYNKIRKNNWPSSPNQTYKNKGWKNWYDFLGKVVRVRVDFLSFEECREEVRECKIKNNIEYRKNRKNNWPSAPDQIYKNKGWKGWDGFLGKVGFLSFEECKKEVRECKFKNQIQYKKNRKNNWPSNPDKNYKNKGWKDWYDFLGK